MSAVGRSAARTGRVATVTTLLTAVLLAASSGPSPARAAAAPSAPLAGAAAVGSPEASAAPAPRAGWGWPLRPDPAVRRPFVAPPARWAPGHRGIDLDAAQGRVVLAPAPGVVAFAGRVAGRGVVSVQHGAALRSSVEPVRATVAVGTVVAAGDAIGVLTSEASHCSPGSCLHWGVRRDGAYVDPLGLLTGRGPAVLLPLAAPRAVAGPRLLRDRGRVLGHAPR